MSERQDIGTDRTAASGNLGTDATATSGNLPTDATTPGGPPPEQRTERPERIGRYEIVSTLGEGGMGVVYEALDPELDRRVAVKVMRAATTDGTYGERMRREAQALAKLSHAHVVAVYDAGTTGDEVFIVMQLIDGVTLDRYLANTRSTVAQIVALYVQAARGLAAAHAAGIVHRDFKPSNALVDRSGVVRVSDFGLATAPIALAPAGTMPSGSFRANLTQPGLLGTPTYMAPEQFANARISPATDQFALCIALWEALYGERPFAGDDLATLSDNVTAGRRRAVPAKARVPAHVHAAIERGLAHDPTERWASMAALADALAPRSHRTRTYAGLAAAVLAAGAIVFAMQRDPDAFDTCAARAHEIDAVWPAARATAIRGRVKRDAADAIERRITTWRAMRDEVCRAPQVPALAQRSRCLELARVSIASTIDGLGTVEPAEALGVVHGSIDPARCTEADSKVVSTNAVEHDATYAEIERMRVTWQGGHSERVIAEREAMTARIAALHDPSLAAHWNLQLAMAFARSGDAAASRATLRTCAENALAAGLDEQAVLCWSRLAAATAEAGDLRLADDLIGVARGIVARTTSRWLHAIIDEHAAGVELDRGDFTAAVKYARSALDTMVATHSDPQDVLDAYGALLDAQTGAHDWRGVLETAEPGLALAVRTSGPDDMQAVQFMRSIAVAKSGLGEAGAKAAWEQVMAAVTRTHAPDDPAVMRMLMDHATSETVEGSHTTPEALAAIHRAVEIGEAKLPPKDPERAQLYEILAYVQTANKETEAAQGTYRRLIAFLETIDDPMGLSRVLFNYADTLKEAGKCDEAVPLFKRTVKVAEQTGQKAILQGASLGMIAICTVRAGNLTEGIAELKHALAILDEAGDAIMQATPVRFELAKAVYKSGDKSGGVAIAKSALDLLADHPPPADELRAEISKWVAHPG